MRLSVTSRGRRNLPFYKKLEKNMLAACRAAGASAWYVPDDFLTLGPELVTNGDFSNGVSGWSPATFVTLANVGGELEITANGSTAYPGATQVVQTTPGKMYQVSLKSRRGTSAASTGIAISRYGGSGNLLAIAINAATTTGQYTTFITSDWAAWNLLPHASGKPAGAGTVYFDDISIREVLSAKDFQDSSGTLLAYLGGTVGAMLDGGYWWEYGPELVFDTAFDNPSAWSLSQPTAGAVSIASGALSISTTDGSYCQAAVYPLVGAVIGRTVEYVIEVTAASGGGVAVVYGGAASPAYTTPGIYRGLLTATSTSALLIRRAAVVASSGTVTSLSVRERKGNAVTQATAGNRPLVSRIPRKLGPELMTGIAITGTNGTNTGSATANSFTINQVDTSSVVGATLSLSAVPTIGKSYYITSTPSGMSGSGFKVDNVAWTPTAVQVSAGFVLTATSSPSAAIYVYRNTAPSAGTFSNVSVREVLEWSNVLTFDGTNDSLATAASVIGATLTQPYTMIAWGNVGAIGAGRRCVGDNVRQLGIDSTGKATIGHNAGSIVGTTTLAQGRLIVIEAIYNGSTCDLKLNNIVEYSGAIVAPAGTVTATMIGQSGSGAAYWNSDIGGVVVCPAVMTDAQRLAVRKFAAAQMGLIL